MADLEMMTVKEVAEYLKMKPVTIYKLAKEGRIPAFKVEPAGGSRGQAKAAQPDLRPGSAFVSRTPGAHDR